MLEGSQWAGPPPQAAQPMGIQSTAGAVPVFNEKGEVSMKKVKVHRYVSGKRPEYAPASSDEEITDEEDFTAPRTAAALQPSSPKHSQAQLTETELSDPRLRRLLALRQQQQAGPPRRVEQAEVIEGSDNEDESSVVQAKDATTVYEDKDDDEDRTESGTLGLRHRLADADLESDSGGEEAEVDEEALATRRQCLRERAISKIQQEEEVLGKEDEGSDQSSEEESSEYSEETDSEAEGPRLKPVFVRKKERHTIQQRETLQQSTKQAENESRRRAEERRRDMLRMIEQENRATAPPAAGGMGGVHRLPAILGVGAELQHDNVSTNSRLEDVNTDDEADDAEYEAWKLRELRRLKRDKEEQESLQKEREEVEKLRHMTDEERRIEQRNNPKLVTNKAVKGKYKFLQKYYHRGAFFLDNEDEVYKRDFSASTLEDHFDKSILPKVMQVKNFGRSGRTKYTHLVDQDTTTFDSPWAADTQINHKFSNSAAGGMKELYDVPVTKKRISSSSGAGPSSAPRK